MREALAAWHAKTYASDKSGERLVPWASIDCVRIPGNDASGQKHLSPFLMGNALQAAFKICSRRAVLFWGWREKRRSVRIYGIFLPPVVLGTDTKRDANVGDVLVRALRLATIFKHIYDPQPSPYAFGSDTPSDVVDDPECPMPSLAWLFDGSPTTDGAFAFAEMPRTPNGLIEFRADKLSDYLGYFTRTHTAANALRLLQPIVVPENRLYYERILTGYLLEPNLTDQRERLVDFKGRVLLLLYVMHLLREEVEARKSDQPRYGINLEQGETALAMLNALATQAVLRQRYLHGNSEQRVLGALHEGGAVMLAFQTQLAHDSPVLVDLFKGPTAVTAPSSSSRKPTAVSSRRKANQPEQTVTLCKQLPATVLCMADSKFPRSKYTRECDQAGLGLGIITEHDTHGAASRHWVSATKADLSCSVMLNTDELKYRITSATERPFRPHITEPDCNDVAPTSAFWDHCGAVSGFERLLLKDVPVQLFGMVDTMLFNADALAEAIHYAVLSSKGTATSMVLFYQGKLNLLEGDLQSVAPASARRSNQTFFLVPGLILHRASMLESFVRLVQAQLILYDDDSKPLAASLLSDYNRETLYEPGNRLYMRAGNLPFELHPSLRYFKEYVFPFAAPSGTKKPNKKQQQQVSVPVPMEVVAVQRKEAPAVSTVEELPFPRTLAERNAAIERKLSLFLRQYAPQSGFRVPNVVLFVPEEDMDHSCPILAGSTTCCYRPARVADRDSKCTTCSSKPTCYRDSQGKLWRCIHYAEAPMWQFGRALRTIRQWHGLGKPLEEHMQSIGMQSIWKALQTCYLQNTRDSRDTMRNGVKQSYLAFNEALATKELDEAIKYIIATEANAAATDPAPAVDMASLGQHKRPKVVITNEDSLRGSDAKSFVLGYTFQQIVDRVKGYIGLDPKLFYKSFLGPDVFDCGGGKLSWVRKNGPFCVWTTSSRVSMGSRMRTTPGSFSDLKTDRHGDAIRYIMLYRYGTDDNAKGFRAALFFCHAWVLRTYGPKALATDPTAVEMRPTPIKAGTIMSDTPPPADQALPGITAQLKSIANKQRLEDPDTSKRIKDARQLWKDAARFRPDGPSNPALEYLRNVRKITSSYILFEQDALRFHPCFPISNDGVHLQYPVLLSKFVDPIAYVTAPATQLQSDVYGVQNTALNEQEGSKAQALEVVKKGRGIVGSKFVPVHVHRPRVELVGSEAPLQFQQVRVAICEGVETAASVAEACGELDVWAAGGVHNIGNFPFGLQGDKEIFYCADNDNKEEGKQRNLRQAEKLCALGWRVHLVTPEMLLKPAGLKGTDFNTLLMHIVPKDAALETIRDTVLHEGQVYEPTAKGKMVASGAAADEDSPSGSMVVSFG